MKKHMRKEFLEKRNRLDYSLWESLSIKIQEIFLGSHLYQESNNIMLYSAFRNEVATGVVLKKALADGKVVLFPRVEEREEMTARKISSPKDLVVGSYGILEPSLDCEISTDVDLLLVPGVAFDRLGYRLGYGVGYYDRFLKKSIVKYRVGLAFEFQVIARLPRDNYDERLDYLVTEKGILDGFEHPLVE